MYAVYRGVLRQTGVEVERRRARHVRRSGHFGDEGPPLRPVFGTRAVSPTGRPEESPPPQRKRGSSFEYTDHHRECSAVPISRYYCYYCTYANTNRLLFQCIGIMQRNLLLSFTSSVGGHQPQTILYQPKELSFPKVRNPYQFPWITLPMKRYLYQNLSACSGGKQNLFCQQFTNQSDGENGRSTLLPP